MNQDVRDFIANEKQLKQKHEEILRDVVCFLNLEMKQLGRKLDILEFVKLSEKLKELLKGHTVAITDIIYFKEYVDCILNELYVVTAGMELTDEETTELLNNLPRYTDDDARVICAYLAYPKDKLYGLLSDNELLDCIMSFGTPEMIKDKMDKLGVKSRKQFLDNIQKEQAVRWLRLKAQEVLRKYKE